MFDKSDISPSDIVTHHDSCLAGFIFRDYADQELWSCFWVFEARPREKWCFGACHPQKNALQKCSAQLSDAKSHVDFDYAIKNALCRAYIMTLPSYESLKLRVQRYTANLLVHFIPHVYLNNRKTIAKITFLLT